jgi:hypothetical protein
LSSEIALTPAPHIAAQVAWRVPIDDESLTTCSVGLRRLDPELAALGKVRPAVKVDPDPLTEVDPIDGTTGTGFVVGFSVVPIS